MKGEEAVAGDFEGVAAGVDDLECVGETDDLATDDEGLGLGSGEDFQRL